MTRIILIFFIAFTTSTLLFGQTKSEDEYKASSDQFLIKTIGKRTFEKHYGFYKIWWYSLNGDIMTIPKSLTDSSVTHVISSYWLTIDELEFKQTVDIIYDKERNTWAFKNIEYIPDFACSNIESAYIDTSMVRKILISKGVKNESIQIGGFEYDEEQRRFIWRAIEIVIPYDSTTKKEIINVYLLDAKSGIIISEQKDIAVNPYPEFRGVR